MSSVQLDRKGRATRFTSLICVRELIRRTQKCSQDSFPGRCHLTLHLVNGRARVWARKSANTQRAVTVRKARKQKSEHASADTLLWTCGGEHFVCMRDRSAGRLEPFAFSGHQDQLVWGLTRINLKSTVSMWLVELKMNARWFLNMVETASTRDR